MENITNATFVIPFFDDSSQGLLTAVNYFRRVLSVVRAPNNLTIPPICATTRSNDSECTSLTAQACGPFATIPEEHLGNITVCDPICREVGGGVDTDFILYVSASDGGTLILL